MTAANIEVRKQYLSNFYRDNNKVKHYGKCQSDICIHYRETIRVAPPKRYVDGKWAYCGDCETTVPSTFDVCPCCKKILRKRSRYVANKEQVVVRQ